MFQEYLGFASKVANKLWCDADEDHTSEDCVFISQQEKRMKMVEKRMAFTGIAFDETTLWIVGDSCEDNNVLCSTEFLKLGHPSV